MHFFLAKLLSIAVMTYTYVYHLRNLSPIIRLMGQRINLSMRPQHVRTAHDPTVVSFPDNPWNTRKLLVLFMSQAGGSLTTTLLLSVTVKEF